MVLTADGKHLMSDAYTSLGLIVGLIIIKLTGYILLDSILLELNCIPLLAELLQLYDN